MRIAWWMGVAACGVGVGVGVSWAGPLDRAVVDRDATWMFHVDVEAGLSSTLGGLAKEKIAEEGARPGEDLIKKFGVDPLKDIKGLTMYGFKAGEDDGVAVIETTAAVDTLGTRLVTAGLE